MSRLFPSTRYFGTLAGACAVIGLSVMLVVPSPESVATEETPVVARFEPQAATETLRFKPSDFDISRSVPVRIKAPRRMTSAVASPRTDRAAAAIPATQRPARKAAKVAA